LRGNLFRIKEELDKAQEAYAEAYKLSPSDRDIVHNYVGGLMYFDKNEEAYTVIKKYFTDTPQR